MALLKWKAPSALRWVATGALLIKLFLALFTTGTNDSITWDQDVMVLRSAGAVELYRHGVDYPTSAGTAGARQQFIHPPALLHLLRLLGAMQDKTGLAPHVWLRIFCGLADAGTLALLWLMFPGSRYGPALVLVAASPISILVSGFHGNTDPIMMCFVVLSLWLLERERAGWAGAAFGLALGVKLVPVIFAPAILFSLGGPRKRLQWAGAAMGVWVAAGLPWLLQSPELILRTILGYSGAVGLWGFPLLSNVLQAFGCNLLDEVYIPGAKWLALAGTFIAPAILRRRQIRPGLFAQCGLVASLFLFLSPGFGLQYLAWTVPWLLVLPPGLIARYSAMTGVFLLGVYAEAAWTNGGALYADSRLGGNLHVLVGVGIVCWIGMGIMSRRYWLLAIRPVPEPNEMGVRSPEKGFQRGLNLS